MLLKNIWYNHYVTVPRNYVRIKKMQETVTNDDDITLK
jgi:hypothetical protein